MVIFSLGVLLLAVGSVLDTIFRVRMTRAGHKWALLQGGAFDYSRYHKVRRQYGWAVWPVYLMWATWICGIVLIIAGFYFRNTPTHNSL